MERAEIEANLRAVGEKLAGKGLTGQILIVGGAYMTLVVRNRSATKDVDAYIAKDQGAVRTAVREVANERGLPADWLNDAVKGFIYAEPETELWAAYPGLEIYTPTMDYIFAMKAEAARAASFDFEDLVALRDKLGLRSAEQAIAIIEKYIPANRLTPRTQLTVETLFEDVGGSSDEAWNRGDDGVSRFDGG